MNRISTRILGACVLMGAIAASAVGAPMDFSGLGCPTKSSTPVTAATLGPSDSQQIKVSPGTYGDSPCHVFIVEWTISSNAGSLTSNISSSRLFSFDSLTNEIIATHQECDTYSQNTLIFKKKSGGKWKPGGYGVLTGQWTNGKCKFVAGDPDFRKSSFHPPSSGSDKYRVSSRVWTGPSSSPNVRGVCIGARFANIENVLQRSCTDPAQ